MYSQNSILSSGRHAFSLIELLVVIAIIAILAGMVLAGVMTVKAKGQVGKARVEASAIVSAISQYEAEYGRPPCTKKVWDATAANGATNDFSYGTGNFRTYGSPNYITDNAEIIAALRNSGPTATLNAVASALNPKNGSLLDAPVAGNNISGGVGLDGVFRDPWGNPYIISVDTDSSGTTTDGFYRRLIELKVRSGNSRSTEPAFANYPVEQTGRAVVWSLGPDGRADPTPNLNTPQGMQAVQQGPDAILKVGDNADNVLSWTK